MAINVESKVANSPTDCHSSVARTTFALILSSILLFSAISHLTNPYYFLASVYEYRLVSNAFAIIASLTLPYIQIVFALAIFMSFWCESAYLGCTALFVIYFCAQSSVVLRSMTIDCGCFGPLSHHNVDALSLTMTGALCIGSALMFWTERQHDSTSTKVIGRV